MSHRGNSGYNNNNNNNSNNNNNNYNNNNYNKNNSSSTSAGAGALVTSKINRGHNSQFSLGNNNTSNNNNNNNATTTSAPSAATTLPQRRDRDDSNVNYNNMATTTTARNKYEHHLQPQHHNDGIMMNRTPYNSSNIRQSITSSNINSNGSSRRDQNTNSSRGHVQKFSPAAQSNNNNNIRGDALNASINSDVSAANISLTSFSGAGSPDSKTSTGSGEQRLTFLKKITGDILQKYFHAKTSPTLQHLRDNLARINAEVSIEQYVATWFCEREASWTSSELCDFLNEISSSVRIKAAACVPLFEDLNRAFSEACKIRSLPGFLERHGKTLIDPVFGRIFTTRENADACLCRHFRHYPIQINFWRQSFNLDGIFDQWRSGHSGPVLVLSGSSGVGKTCAALSLARTVFGEDTTFVVYLTLIRGVNHSSVNYIDKSKRDKGMQDVMMEAIAEAIFRNVNAANHRGASSEDTSSYSSDTINMKIIQFGEPDSAQKSHVVVIVDECGANPLFLPGLVAAAPAICRRLHNAFFDDEASATKSRVHFIASGTGANYSVVEPSPSEPTQNTCFNLDSVFKQVDPLAALLQPATSFFDDEKATLMRLSTSFAKSLKIVRSNQDDDKALAALSSEEEQASDLCTNFRATACFLDEFYSYAKTGSVPRMADLRQLHTFRKIVGHVLPRAVSRYCSMNGLQLVANPTLVIACAVAVDLHRLPFLPPIPISAFADMADPMTPATNLYTALCTSCGILVDRVLRRVASPGEGCALLESCDGVTNRSSQVVSIQNIVPGAARPQPGQGPLVLDAGLQVFNRFQCSSAVRAMFRIAIGIAPSNSAHWSGAEQRFADLCLLVAPLSDIVEKLYAAVDAAFRKAHNNNNNAKVPLTMIKYLQLLDGVDRFRDPSSRLYQLLRFGVGVTSAEKHQLLSSPLRDINPAVGSWTSHPSETIVENAVAVASELFEFIREKVRTNTVVVLTSPPMEQFADGIVVGPKKVILFQVKSLIRRDAQHATSFKIKWRDELEKMGLLAQRERHQHKADKLRELWLATLLAAASANAPTSERYKDSIKKEFSVKYFNDADSSSIRVETKKDDVSLHVVFFADCGRSLAEELMTQFKDGVHFTNVDEKSVGNPMQQQTNQNVVIGWEKALTNKRHGFNKIESSFRDDLRLCSVDFVAVQRKDGTDGELENTTFATSFAASPIPSSTELPPIRQLNASCCLPQMRSNHLNGNNKTQRGY